VAGSRIPLRAVRVAAALLFVVMAIVALAVPQPM